MRGVAHTLVACGPPCKYRDTLKMLAGPLCSFEELSRARYSKEGECMAARWLASAVGWTLMPDQRPKLKLGSRKKSQN